MLHALSQAANSMASQHQPCDAQEASTHGSALPVSCVRQCAPDGRCDHTHLAVLIPCPLLPVLWPCGVCAQHKNSVLGRAPLQWPCYIVVFDPLCFVQSIVPTCSACPWPRHCDRTSAPQEGALGAGCRREGLTPKARFVRTRVARCCRALCPTSRTVGLLRMLPFDR